MFKLIERITMEKTNINLNLDTDIKILDENGVLLAHTKNSLTRQALPYLHTLLTSTAHISTLHTSALTGDTGVPSDTTNFIDSTPYPISSSYATLRSDGKLILVFTTNIVHNGTIRRLGLGSTDLLCTIANTNVIVNNSAITILYQIEIGGLL